LDCGLRRTISYLPVLLGGPLVASAMWNRVRGRPPLRGGAVLWIVALTGQSLLTGIVQTTLIAQRRLASSLRTVVAEIPGDLTIIGIGDNLCHESPSLVASNPAIFAIPATADDATPTLIPLDAHTLLVRAPESMFDIPTEERRPARSPDDERGPAWIVQRPPSLVVLGSQRIAGATVSIAERGARGIGALRYEFDLPLSQLAFVRAHRCEPPERVEVGALRTSN